MLHAKFLQLGERLIKRGAWYFAPLSIFYALLVFCKNKLYDLHLLKPTRVKPIVVSVGNITAGGTGKTPFVHLLAQIFSHRKVAILSRGYGSLADEAILLKNRLPKASIHIGKDRAKLAETINADLIILDDGMQHRKLHRDFEIVLGPSTGHYLPWGFLRDSPKRIPKADAHFQLDRDFTLKVNRILDLHGNATPSIRGWKVGLFCAIAHPERFKKTLEDLGAVIVSEKYFGDHAKIDLSKLDPSIIWICTEKDKVKLPKTQLLIYYLEMQMEIKGPAWEKLVEKIGAAINNRST